MTGSCTSCNVALSIRVASPGDDGAVTQANTVAAQAAALAATTVTAPTAREPTLPLPQAIAWVPPPAAPPLAIAASPEAPLRELEWSSASADMVTVPVPALALPAAAPPATGLPPPPRRPGAAARVHAEHRRVVRRTRDRTTILTESSVSTSVVLVQRSAGTRTPPAPATRSAPTTAAPPERLPPQAPLAPSGPGGPAAGGAAGAAGHGGGSGTVTASVVGGLVLVVLTLLSSFVPRSLPVRRRLSDDRQARPG